MAYNEIKHCPHCGGSADLMQNYSYKVRSYFVFVRCSMCGAQGKIYNTETEIDGADWNVSDHACMSAIEAWNMRTGER